jgi:[acyl-carrier-protein] S-malonyltransferase
MGHSLGEFTALYASETINFENILKLVNKRGEIMSKNLNIDNFEMTALTYCNESDIKEACADVESKINKICNIANINSPQQVVISGNKS